MFRPTPLRLFARSAVRLSGPTPAPGAYRQHVQRQKASGLSAASLGLVALLGWSAVVFGVAGRKEPKAPAAIADKVAEAEASSGSAGEGQQAAFNPETEVEPKGVECVDKFRAMQDCFRKHPDIYGNDDEDDEDDDLVSAAQAALATPDDDFVKSA